MFQLNPVKYLIALWFRIFPRKKAKRRQNQPPQRFETGPTYYLGDLLESLDDYNMVIRKLKQHDESAYDLYTRVGCSVGSKHILISRELSARWRDGSERPATMMVHFRQTAEENAEVDRIYPTFLLINKMRMKPGVQFTNGDFFECVVFYRERRSTKIIIGVPFYMSVDSEGHVSLLRILKQSPGKSYSKKLRSAKASIRGRRTTIINHPVQRWGVPDYLIEWANDRHTTPAKLADMVFSACAEFADTQNNGLLIRAKKNNICAAFSIDLLRTPYFFKDRIKIKTASGRTKPIFHIVRTHQRKGGSFVRTHFRGLRRFDWHGHQVVISMPGFHHVSFRDFTLRLLDQNDPDRPKPDKQITSAEIGNIFDRHMDDDELTMKNRNPNGVSL